MTYSSIVLALVYFLGKLSIERCTCLLAKCICRAIRSRWLTKRKGWEVRILSEVEGRYRDKIDIYDLLTHYMWINTTIQTLSEDPFCARAKMQAIKKGADRVLIYLHQETKVNLKKSAQDLKIASEAVVHTVVGSRTLLPVGPPPELRDIDALPEDFDLNNAPWLQDDATATQSHRFSASSSTMSASSPRRPPLSVSASAAMSALPSTLMPPGI